MLKRFFASAALACALALAAGAQNTTTMGNIVSYGVPCGAANCVYYQLPPHTAWVSVIITGTWTGTLEMATTAAPNANYANLSTIPWSPAITETANGTWTVATLGDTYLRVRATAWTSGQAHVAMDSTLTQAPLINPVFTGELSVSSLDVDLFRGNNLELTGDLKAATAEISGEGDFGSVKAGAGDFGSVTAQQVNALSTVSAVPGESRPMPTPAILDSSWTSGMTFGDSMTAGTGATSCHNALSPLTAIFAEGDTTITVSDATGIAVGDLIYGVGFDSVAVTAISGTTLTMASAATAAAAGSYAAVSPCWAEQFAYDAGVSGNFHNYAVGGDTSCDLVNHALNRTLPVGGDGTLRAMMVGFNDATAMSRAWFSNGLGCLSAALIYLSADSSLAVQAGSITPPVGWSTDTTYSQVTGLTTTAAVTTATFTLGASSITVGSATGIAAGMSVAGTGIPAATNVTAISGTTVTLSNATTAASSGNYTFAGAPLTIPWATTVGSQGAWLLYKQCDGASGQAEVNTSGYIYGSTPFPIATANGSICGIFSFNLSYNGLPAGANTTVITPQKGTVTVMGVWVAPPDTQHNYTPLWFAGTPRGNAWPVGAWGEFNLWAGITKQYYEQEQSVARVLANQGLPIFFVPVQSFYLNTPAEEYDQRHPNNLGHTHIAQAFLSPLPNVPDVAPSNYNGFIPGPYASYTSVIDNTTQCPYNVSASDTYIVVTGSSTSPCQVNLPVGSIEPTDVVFTIHNMSSGSVHTLGDSPSTVQILGSPEYAAFEKPVNGTMTLLYRTGTVGLTYVGGYNYPPIGSGSGSAILRGYDNKLNTDFSDLLLTKISGVTTKCRGGWVQAFNRSDNWNGIGIWASGSQDGSACSDFTTKNTANIPELFEVTGQSAQTLGVPLRAVNAGIYVVPTETSANSAAVFSVDASGNETAASSTIQGISAVSVGTDIASASTITMTGQIAAVTGTTTINCLAPPASACHTGRTTCQFTLLPTGLWNTTASYGSCAGGSYPFAKSSTAVVGQAMIVTLGANSYWYPSY